MKNQQQLTKPANNAVPTTVRVSISASMIGVPACVITNEDRMIWVPASLWTKKGRSMYRCHYGRRKDLYHNERRQDHRGTCIITDEERTKERRVDAHGCEVNGHGRTQVSRLIPL